MTLEEELLENRIVHHNVRSWQVEAKQGYELDNDDF